MCVNLSHTHASLVYVWSMVWTMYFKGTFWERKKKNTQIPGGVLGSNPEDTTVICSQEPKN